MALKIVVSPKKVLLVQDLHLNKDKYKRIQDDHPENSVHYLNSLDGITVDAILNNGCEQVVGISYHATARNRELRCGKMGQDTKRKRRNQMSVHVRRSGGDDNSVRQ